MITTRGLDSHDVVTTLMVQRPCCTFGLSLCNILLHRTNDGLIYSLLLGVSRTNTTDEFTGNQADYSAYHTGAADFISAAFYIMR